MASSTSGRFMAAATGLVIGTAVSAYLLSDYELIKRLDDPNDPSTRPTKFSFSMRPSEPIRLKPEVEKKYKDFQTRVEHEKKVLEESRKDS